MVAQRICASSHGKRDESQLMLESIAQLAAFICEPFNLNVCRIGAGALGDVLCKQLGKHKWDFSSHALSESGLDALVHLLDKNTTVTELNLQNQKLERGVITRFVNALASNPYALRTLKLGGNECRAEGARAIAKLLGGKNSTLTDLDVRDCNLGVAGGRLIGQALEDNTSLTSLNLSRNQLCGTLWNDPCIDPTSKACVIIDQVIAKRSLVATEHLEQRRFEIGALVECNMGSFRDGTSCTARCHLLQRWHLAVQVRCDRGGRCLFGEIAVHAEDPAHEHEGEVPIPGEADRREHRSRARRCRWLHPCERGYL